MEYLNEDLLRQMDYDALCEYHKLLQKQLGKYAIYELQVYKVLMERGNGKIQ